jgi:Polyketide cyclase / dehydrase and lipid transport
MPVSRVVVAATLPVEQERLWALLCDTRRYPEWVEMTTAVVRTDGPTRPGSTYEERNRLVGPFTVRSRWTVTEFDPPRRQQHIGTGVAGLRDLRVAFQLEPAGTETRLTLAIDFVPPLGRLGRMLDRLVLARLILASQRRSLGRLTAIVTNELPQSG